MNPLLPFEWILAMRFMREGRMQTLLIISGVALGVSVIVFISALISGLQIGLLDRPTSGRLIIAGVEAARLDDAALTRLRATNVGFVFQFHKLLRAFTAQENVMLPLLAARGRPDAAMQRRAAELIGAVGLAKWAGHLTNELSGGQQQRVAIARALVMQPALVLADEPTGNLDTQSADSVFRLLRQVNRDSATSFLIVTHDPRPQGANPGWPAQAALALVPMRAQH